MTVTILDLEKKLTKKQYKCAVKTNTTSSSNLAYFDLNIVFMAAASSLGKTDTIIAYEKDRKPVRLVYDTWTPRPHFIVVQCEKKQDASADELQATYEIVGLFLHENSQFDKDAILSFHRGRWYQQHTGMWHAHLCVPKEPYLNQASDEVIYFD